MPRTVLGIDEVPFWLRHKRARGDLRRTLGLAAGQRTQTTTTAVTAIGDIYLLKQAAAPRWLPDGQFLAHRDRDRYLPSIRRRREHDRALRRGGGADAAPAHLRVVGHVDRNDHDAGQKIVMLRRHRRGLFDRRPDRDWPVELDAARVRRDKSLPARPTRLSTRSGASAAGVLVGAAARWLEVK